MSVSRFGEARGPRRSLGRTLAKGWRRAVASVRRVFRRRRGPRESLRQWLRELRELPAKHERLEAQYWDHLALVRRLSMLEDTVQRLLDGRIEQTDKGQAPGTAAPPAVVSPLALTPASSDPLPLPGSSPLHVETVVPRSEMAGQEPPRRPLDPAARRLLVSSVFDAGDVAQRLGGDCYSYHFVFRAFAPLLERWGSVRDVVRAAVPLDDLVQAAFRQRCQPVHLAFLPLQYLRLSSQAPNIAFPFWEFPDIPHYDVAGDPRNNWVRVAERLALVLTACDFTRQSFLKAGVRAPIEVVPVPVRSAYFDLPFWEPNQRVVLETPCYLLPRAAPAQADGDPLVFRVSDRVELSGVVFSTVFNPFDLRKNWQMVLGAFLTALADRDDATLVLKLAAGGSQGGAAVEMVFHCYLALGIAHRCRVAIVPAYLTDEQMVELTRASTFYVNASRAEGACLPLQDALAAGRPGIAPSHTAMAEYIDPSVALVVESAPEPTYWPWDPQQRPTTVWHRVDRQSLVDALRSAYELARGPSRQYFEMAACGRRRMAALCSAEAVWPRLAAALDKLWL